MRDRWLAWLKRRWLYCLVATGLLVFGIVRYHEFKQIVSTLIHGRWEWVLVAILLQVVVFVLYAVLYQVSFFTVNVKSRLSDLVPLLFASMCIDVMVPSGGVSSVALFVDDAARRGQSSARAAQGALLVLAADLATMVPLLLYALHYLSAQRVLHAYQVLGVAAFVAFVGGLAAALLLGLRWPHWVRGLLQGIQSIANRVAGWFRRPAPLAEDWAHRNAAEFTGAAAGIAAHPHRVVRALILGLIIHVIDVIGLYAIFLAYQQPVPAGAVVAGFALDVVFSVVSFIPRGMGVAEGVITVALTSLGVPAAKALVIALVARGLNIWLPFLPGFFFLRKVRTFGAAGS